MKSRRNTTRAKPTTTAEPTRTAVLIAVLGSTPAVLTEALWCLSRENPPVLPDSIVVITTTHGQTALQEQLLTPLKNWSRQTVWQALRKQLLGRRFRNDRLLHLETPVLISMPDPSTGTAVPLEDIRNAEENFAAGEKILGHVRYYANPETRVIGLLAGGRKTMGALLHAALSLAGRPGDRLLHVLVNQPFDDPRLSPAFYFPCQPGSAMLRLPDGTTIALSAAKPEIADVPLVTLGELVNQHSAHPPATFAGFIRTADAAIQEARSYKIPLTLSYRPATRTFSVNTWRAILPAGRPAALCKHLCRAAQEDLENLDRVSLAARMERRGESFNHPSGGTGKFSDNDISNALNVIREHLAAAGVPAPVLERLLPKRAPIGFNRDGVTIAPG